MLKAGTVVGGKYRLRHLIAEGGMAEVYLAEPIALEKTNELCALKRLLPALAENPVFIQMFFKEALLSQTMSHKNIVACYESFCDGKDSYLAMEFVLGKEIGVWLSSIKELDTKERTKVALAIGLGVCDALIYIHDVTNQRNGVSGIVHGDISPQNIMIAIDGCVKLYDFGAAITNASAITAENELVRGNLHYMSPEQLIGAPIDQRSDVFSLGLVLLLFLSGDSLVVKRNQTSLNDGASWDPLQSIDDEIFVNDEVRDFFTTALALKAKHRFSSAHAMRMGLHQIAETLALDDPQKFLCETMGKLSLAASATKNRKSSTDGRYFSYLGVAAVSLGVFVWGIVAVFADLFEPKTRHNVPFWPSEQKIAAPALPPQPLPDMTSAHARTLVSKTPKVNKANVGILSLKVKPWAEVFIDGKFFGSTPMAGLSLPEGEYLVQLRNPNVSAVALRMVKIYADKKTELIHNF